MIAPLLSFDLRTRVAAALVGDTSVHAAADLFAAVIFIVTAYILYRNWTGIG